jgi:hypothetical protein
VHELSTKYHSLFTWQDSDLHELILWERVKLFTDMARDIHTLTHDLEYEVYAT